MRGGGPGRSLQMNALRASSIAKASKSGAALKVARNGNESFSGDCASGRLNKCSAACCKERAWSIME